MRKLIAAVKRLIRRPFEMHKDLKLECAECGGTFRFEWGEQQFFKSRGLTPPKRCGDCRSGGRRRRGRRDERGEHRNGFEGRGPRDEGRRDDGRRDEGRRDRNDDREPGRSPYIDDRPFYGEGGDRGRDRGDRGRGRRRR